MYAKPISCHHKVTEEVLVLTVFAIEDRLQVVPSGCDRS